MPEAQRTILFVDDVPMFRELGSVFLSRCGNVLTACTGVEALARARESLPGVVVLDSSLPDVPGDRVCEQIKASPGLEETSVVLLTSGGSREEYRRAVDAGADDVISKPIERVSLVETVQRFVRFVPPRGLPRVTLRTPVRVHADDTDAWGTIRDLSRGGLFVESAFTAQESEELQVEFRLRENEAIQSTAQVVWTTLGDAEHEAGMGLRFLDLDSSTARALEDYVHSHATQSPEPAPAGENVA